jgi:2-C-methyl-D-erythritol 4-phosphate cytidylyltransferase
MNCSNCFLANGEIFFAKAKKEKLIELLQKELTLNAEIEEFLSEKDFDQIIVACEKKKAKIEIFNLGFNLKTFLLPCEGR